MTPRSRVLARASSLRGRGWPPCALRRVTTPRGRGPPMTRVVPGPATPALRRRVPIRPSRMAGIGNTRPAIMIYCPPPCERDASCPPPCYEAKPMPAIDAESPAAPDPRSAQPRPARRPARPPLRPISAALPPAAMSRRRGSGGGQPSPPARRPRASRAGSPPARPVRSNGRTSPAPTSRSRRRCDSCARTAPWPPRPSPGPTAVQDRRRSRAATARGRLAQPGRWLRPRRCHRRARPLHPRRGLLRHGIR